MEFQKFNQAIREHFKEMCKDTDHLFEVEADKNELWNLYLDSFPQGTNRLFRKCREYDCSSCRHFFKTFGRVVVIRDSVVHSIWELTDLGDTFQPVADALDAFIKARPVSGLFVTRDRKIGVAENFELMEDGSVRQWNHLSVYLPNRFVIQGGESFDEIRAPFCQTKQVFRRSLEEISDLAVDTVLELIAQKSLYRGEEWQPALKEFKRYKAMYAATPAELRENFAWEQSVHVGMVVGRIRNHSMGTLLVDISEGMNLDEAVRRYESIMAPANYKRPKAEYTRMMLEDARKTIEKLGYLPSLGRRFATLDDITINNILFCNRDAAKRIRAAGNLFEEMEKEIAVDPRKFSRIQEISIEDFIQNVLPTARSVEAFLETRHAPNMVSLIAPADPESKCMFKWDNRFSWAYSGNITDSSIRENVKLAGGDVEGVLRFSIQWNDEDYNPNDLDAHCKLPSGKEISFRKKHDDETDGVLDVDIIQPKKGKPAVENITWPGLRKLKPGTYAFYVNCYTYRGGKSGFQAEIEFDGTIYSFHYPKELLSGKSVRVAEVTYGPDRGFSIRELLPSNLSVGEVWGLRSSRFVPVSVILYSPNYWDGQQGIGNRHYFFMLDGCVNPEQPNGFYNEFLKPELEQHRRVFEALGAKAHTEDAEDQLSGIGFSSTRHNDLIVKVKGSTERILKIKF